MWIPIVRWISAGGRVVGVMAMFARHPLSKPRLTRSHRLPTQSLKASKASALRNPSEQAGRVFA